MKKSFYNSDLKYFPYRNHEHPIGYVAGRHQIGTFRWFENSDRDQKQGERRVGT